MSIEYYALTIIGVRIPRSDLYKLQSTRNCTCVVHGVSKFCPECGKPFKTDQLVPVALLNTTIEPNTLIGFPVITETREDPLDPLDETGYLYFGSYHFAGGYERASEYFLPFPQENLAHVKKALQIALEPHKLWNDSAAFGIYTIITTTPPPAAQ